MTKPFKRHNTKLTIEVYKDLKAIQTKLLDSGIDKSLNDVLQGCIKYVNDKGITNGDSEYFNLEGSSANN